MLYAQKYPHGRQVQAQQQGNMGADSSNKISKKEEDALRDKSINVGDYVYMEMKGGGALSNRLTVSKF